MSVAAMIIPPGHDEQSTRRDARLLVNFVNIIAAGGMDSAKGLALIANAHPRVKFEELARADRRTAGEPPEGAGRTRRSGEPVQGQIGPHRRGKLNGG